MKKPERRPGRVYPRRKRWRAISKAVLAEEKVCAACGEPATVTAHIVPERVCRRFREDPHQRENLMGSCRSCNSVMSGFESSLGRADRVGFIDEMRHHGWPMERVEKALKLYRL